ncbi:carcinoembryonic antigen-related cell adhesion molecule 5-like [Conger conger]|uniref:carcinoembryonic antigen-related cell adhesion molecule 5-like n=1 Tax=Conger conger TaxID=82655 RepID=UPI002A5A214B|nr:carcinoembryonic antigen-related cell adhesion molecule 5-like [Conger conger]
MSPCLLDSPPKPKLTPEKVEVMEGTSVSLSCSAAAPCPKLPPNLTWTPRLSDSVDQLQENEDKTTSVSSVLTFTASHLHHRQKITCRALYTLQQGGNQKTSEARLTLKVRYPPKNTSVSVSPSGSVLEGSSVTLTCSSEASPPVQNYTWYRVNGTEMNTVGTGQNLTFNVTESSGSEQYYCEAQNEHGKENSTTVLLNVIYPPKNTSVSVSPSGSVLEGSSVTLTCSSKASPPVQNYTWYRVNGTEMNTVGTGQNLTFNVTESSGSEQYYCEAQNEHGKENSTTVLLNVIYMPQISGSGSCSRTAAEISCSCESRGNPSPSMEWRVSGLRVTNSTDRVIREEQLGNTGLRSSLTMRHSQRDTATLLCLSTNALGTSSLQFHAPSTQQHSDSPPKPKLTTEKVEVMEGTSVSLSCSAAAPCPKLPPNLTWTPRLSDSVDQLQENEDKTTSVSSVLTFTASHLYHRQKITCRALYPLQQGGNQTSEASLTLKVRYPPKKTSMSVSPSGSVLEGSTVTLTCSSKASPPVQNYTWYRVNGTEMNTVGTGQNLTFNVTESSGSEQYYCEAQNKPGKENSTTVLLNVIYMPQISGSGSCSRTAAEISCSCESRGNPSPSMEWHVSGLRVSNSTDRVIREEQLGNTGLRSSLTMRHSQGDTATLLCLSTNALGASSLQLHAPSPQQHSGSV